MTTPQNRIIPFAPILPIVLPFLGFHAAAGRKDKPCTALSMAAALRCVVCRGIISGKTGRERVRVSVEDVEEGYALGPPFQSSLSSQHLKYTGLSKNMRRSKAGYHA